MRVDFVVREPGEHKRLISVNLETVPRKGETVFIKDYAREVHSVQWIVGERVQGEKFAPYVVVLLNP